ncbi:MAG: DUF2784 domain-containing protein [Gammaproteobacteria bacterium]|nr:DUF2784 domain-containing protein [Gammaproteobacteria bacterium]
MWYHLAANVLLVIHALFIAFVVLGGLLVLWRRWMAFVHLPIVLYGIAIEWIGWICPLTPLENRMRLAAGEEGYSSSFIEHYLLPLVYPVDYTRELQLMLGALVLLVNLLVYAALGWQALRGRKE